MPIAGLRAQWSLAESSRVVTSSRRPLPNGHGEEVDVSQYFIFLAVLLLVAGILGSVGLRIVDEDALLENAVEDLERSGLLRRHPDGQIT